MFPDPLRLLTVELRSISGLAGEAGGGEKFFVSAWVLPASTSPHWEKGRTRACEARGGCIAFDIPPDGDWEGDKGRPPDGDWRFALHLTEDRYQLEHCFLSFELHRLRGRSDSFVGAFFVMMDAVPRRPARIEAGRRRSKLEEEFEEENGAAVEMQGRFFELPTEESEELAELEERSDSLAKAYVAKYSKLREKRGVMSRFFIPLLL